MVCFILAILIIPLQLLAMNILKPFELKYILIPV